MSSKSLRCFAAAATLTAISTSASAGTLYLAVMNQGNELPPTGEPYTGLGVVILNNTATSATVSATHNIPAASLTAGHIHIGSATVAGPVILPFNPPASPVGPIVWALTPVWATALQNNGLYMQFHTKAHPGGAIRAQLMAARLDPAATNSVEGSLASALDVSAGYAADLDSALVQMNLLSASAQAQALDSLSGRALYIESREGIETMQGTAGTLLAHLDADRSADPKPGLSLFAGLGSDFGTRDANAAEVGSSVTRPYIMGGVEYGFGTGRIGAALSYADGLEKFVGGAGKTEARTTSINGYGETNIGPMVAEGVLGYGWTTFDTSRVLIPVGLVATAAPKGSTVSVTGQLSYPIALNGASLSPYVLVDYQHANVDAYSEAGAGSLGLVVPKQSVSEANGEIGAMLSASLAQSWGTLVPRAQVGFRQVLDNGKTLLSTGIVGSPVAFQTPLLAAKDAVRLEVSLTAALASGWEGSLGYRGMVGDNRAQVHAVEAMIRLRL